MFKSIEDLLALILVVGCLILIFCNIDGEVKGVLAVSAGWVFGRGYSLIKGGGVKHG